MPTKKKVVKKVVEEPTPYELRVEKIAARDLAHRQKRERVHKGLTNANVEAADG